MFPSSNDSPRRKASKRGFRQLGSRSKPGLAVDTNFSRHNGQAPQQVFPYESRTQELSFVSFNDVRASTRAKKGGLKQQLDSRLPIRPAAQRSISDNLPSSRAGNIDSSRPGFLRSQTSGTALLQVSGAAQSSLSVHPLHKRIKGLRPSPLDLSNDVSPSDRAITIGLAMPSASVPTHTPSPHSPARNQHARRVEEVRTPTIVITPAREGFGLSQSPEELTHTMGYRPASSVYSRYTNCAPRHADHGYTPPVPPLPLFVNKQETRQSAVTVFEEDSEALPQARHLRRLTTHSQLPTPRRSRGWWNVVTSPFSASSKSSAFFWRSSTLPEDGADRARMLDDASDMGTSDHHAGVIFTNRALDDDELRTALPLSTGSERPPMPQRSDTAPGALDANAAPVNIYRIPSQGLAAAYYDVNRRFPSMMLEGAGVAGNTRDLEGWSPSHSVAHPEEDRHLAIDDAEIATNSAEHAVEDEPRTREIRPGDGVTKDQINEQGEGPFADSHQTTAEEDQPGAERDLFSTPSEEELKDATPPRPALNDRNNTQATMMSAFSPLSATPIIEEAHTARFVGPSSENGELREVELTPARGLTPPSPGHHAAETVEAIMAPQSVPADQQRQMAEVTSEKAPYRPMLHSRSDSSGSFGLGISDAGSEKELFPPPKPLLRTRLGTDRFGQLAMRSVEGETPSVPWYRRFFWSVASLGASLPILAIMLLVTLVPGQTHVDMAIQAEWLNLTGFPAMPTGVATVIQPNAVKAVSGCVSSQRVWSCDMPASQQETSQSSTSEQPNFRLEIRFRNGTLPKNETQLERRSAGAAANAGALVRRDGWTSSLFTANPAAPSKGDQVFLGQYTDNISAPYNGEETPFYVSLLNTSTLVAKTSNLHKRQDGPYPYPTGTISNSSTSSRNATTDAATSIPRPALRQNGEPAEAELYPFAEAQPLRLFNRGEDDEHYGFYTYFDRSVYISNATTTSSTPISSSNATTGSVPLQNASAVCTWSQTRLHVQIWTRKHDVASLGDQIPLSGLPAVNSTANDMTAPGSFPYPVTVTLDRHGGHAKKKGVYCYGLDEQHHVMENLKMWVDEDRVFGGDLVNAAAVPGSNSTTSLTKRHEEKYEGVDGGSGGCACQWQNWT
ncbi:hypothetical protein LTR36_002649 [Oleoguttula mirabilis]|uniref:Glycoprotease family protein n=1 Tax=Oleoguttula mirabilis TaxID=1507867 RepID=A0AAV9JJW1_9PEZI|nr:hypothetical protein LTR36_002649 [Oleoguttula mirabilis]